MPALLLATSLAVLAVLVSQYGYALQVPFLNDDYVFLDKTRAARFGSLWLPRQLAFHWYRPWSREFHYWALQRAFGTHELPYHVVSFALILVGLGVYASLARRLAGTGPAATATAGLVTMAAWSIPVVWIAGVQDVWMLLFCLLTLLALDAGRRGLAVGACALALLSKETAAVLPAIGAVLVAMRRHRGPMAAVRETAGLWIVLLVWAAVHPLLGGRLFRAVPVEAAPGIHPSTAVVVARTLLSLVSLDALPRPTSGWIVSLLQGLPAVLVLGGLVIWAARSRRARSGADVPGTRPRDREPAGATPGQVPAAPGGFSAVHFGVAWAAIAWLPLLVPAIGWHAYYGLLGACGAWLALGAALARRPLIAASLVAALALARSARASTPSRDWGTEFYQTRAAAFMVSMRADLLRSHPSVPPHSRLFFVAVPSNVGFLTGDAPVMRVWYGDSTLSGGFFTQYRPSPPGARGEDFFFRYAPRRGWIEIASDSNVAIALGDTATVHDVRELAVVFARSGEWRRAAVQFERVARAEPDRPQLAVDAGVARAMAGDTASAAAWLERTLESPAAPESLRVAARQMLIDLRTRSGTGSARGRR